MIPPDDALDLLLDYPVVIYLVLDGYEPRRAGMVLDALGDLDDDSARVTVRLWAQAAEMELREQVN
jgi:hypothetical protein